MDRYTEKSLNLAGTKLRILNATIAQLQMVKIHVASVHELSVFFDLEFHTLFDPSEEYGLVPMGMLQAFADSVAVRLGEEREKLSEVGG